MNDIRKHTFNFLCKSALIAFSEEQKKIIGSIMHRNSQH